mmetsp:Transcript_10090/g.61343  ORF Transcript_10090/g.61343 Transcript_10090/m.61343 type:complete len:260 (-) Transcript_10090:301-1080(-)
MAGQGKIGGRSQGKILHHSTQAGDGQGRRSASGGSASVGEARIQCPARTHPQESLGVDAFSFGEGGEGGGEHPGSSSSDRGASHEGSGDGTHGDRGGHCRRSFQVGGSLGASGGARLGGDERSGGGCYGSGGASGTLRIRIGVGVICGGVSWRVRSRSTHPSLGREVVGRAHGIGSFDQAHGRAVVRLGHRQFARADASHVRVVLVVAEGDRGDVGFAQQIGAEAGSSRQLGQVREGRIGHGQIGCTSFPSCECIGWFG